MVKYAAVVTGQDIINFAGDKIPFWELLDQPPELFLMSIAYYNGVIPKNTRIIFDCGAWTYKENRFPVINGMLLTPFNAYNLYSRISSKGDICIVPDHIPVMDIKFREAFNERSLRLFMEIHKQNDRKTFFPMAVIHGHSENILKETDFVLSLGYTHVAIGGLAVRGRHVDENLRKVEIVKSACPDGTYIHALGLSAESYVDGFKRIGINSFDGANHYTRAFSAGIYYGSDMTHYKVPKLGGDFSTIPSCECKACVNVRSFGQDTRSFGSRVRNLGRAAHNLNIFMRSIK